MLQPRDSNSGPTDRGLSALLCRAGEVWIAIPLDHVLETLRPLPLQQALGTPTFVLGTILLRGEPTPVVDARTLWGASRDMPPGRIVCLRVETRRVALAVDGVVGCRTLTQLDLQELPSLLSLAEPAIVAHIGRVQHELLFVLDAARLVPSLNPLPFGTTRP